MHIGTEQFEARFNKWNKIVANIFSLNHVAVISLVMRQTKNRESEEDVFNIMYLSSWF